VAPGLKARRHAVVDEQIHAPRFLRRHVGRDVEVLHLARDLAREARRIEARDARDPRGAGERPVPGLLDAITEGTDDAEAGDDDSAAVHLYLWKELTPHLTFGVRLDVVDGLLHGGDLLGFLVGDLGLELLLERHHELDGVERIGAEIVDERGLVLDLGLVHAELLGDNFLDRLLDVLHRCSFPKGAVFYDIYMPPLTCRTAPVT